MRVCFFVTALLVPAGAMLACSPAKDAGQKTCTDLSQGYSFHPPGKLAQYDEKVTLTPPLKFRIDRKLGSKDPQWCEGSLYACDGRSTEALTAADVQKALSHPEVRFGLSQGAEFGDLGNGGAGGGSADNFVLVHGKEKLTVGKPCPSPPGLCRTIPPPVAEMVSVLMRVYEQHRADKCSNLPEG